MKPRQPYRSPFWKPDLGGEPMGSSGWEPQPAPAAPQPDRLARPAPSPRRIERAATEHANTYAPSDMALFGRLMDFSKQGHTVRQAEEPARPQRREESARRRDPPARAEAPKHYSGRDLALFQSLQPPSSGYTAPADAARYVPSPQLSASTRGYSQADLDAFDKLTPFGRST